MPQGTYTLGRDRPQFGVNFVSEPYLDEVWGKIPTPDLEEAILPQSSDVLKAIRETARY